MVRTLRNAEAQLKVRRARPVHEQQHPPHHEERTDAQLKQVCV
jgi:hypothetical protein